MRTISEAELKTILDKHGKWIRSEEGGEKANLSCANLSYADLGSANLSCANLSYADLSYADLSHADLSCANLSSANLSYADLSPANLSSANLSSADLSCANLSYADLGCANLSCANLSYADLSYANLSYADLSSANLIVFQFQMSWAYYTFDGTLKIGCQVMPITEWVLGYEEIGKKEGYSEMQIKMYGNFIKSCMEHFESGTKDSK